MNSFSTQVDFFPKWESKMLTEPMFVSQFDPSEDAEQRIANRENENLNAPEWNWCGICCVRMLVLSLYWPRKKWTLEEMYQDAFDRYGVFKMIDGQVIGAFHYELATYINEAFPRSEIAGFHASPERRLTVSDVADKIANGEYVIASVSAKIRELDGEPPENKSGHLVLVYGFEQTENGYVFVLHNSAGFVSTNTQRAVRVPIKRFSECFSGNVISVLSIG